MATEQSSHTQNPFSFFNNMMDEQVDRMNAWFDEVEKIQSKSFDRAEQVIDEAAEAGKTTLEYFENLSHEMRKMSIDTLRQTTESIQSDA